jgi:hypothetical protein
MYSITAFFSKFVFFSFSQANRPLSLKCSLPLASMLLCAWLELMSGRNLRQRRQTTSKQPAQTIRASGRGRRRASGFGFGPTNASHQRPLHVDSSPISYATNSSTSRFFVYPLN